MQFDIRTLLVAAVLTTAFCAGARFLLWRMHPRMPGLARWAAAGATGVLGLALFAAHHPHSTLPMLSLGQLAIVVGFLLSWDGFRRFVDHAPLPRRVVAAFIFVTLGTIVLAHMEHSLTLRAFTNALLISLLSALIANELLSAAQTGQMAIRATGWTFAANAGFFLVRATAAGQSSGTFSNWNPDGFAALPLLWWLCMIIATTLGMVLMTGERLQANLDRQASSDPLTGALNRRAFSILAEKEMARAQRHGRSLSLLMMDLDHFKSFNDLHGHEIGDRILRHFAKTMSLTMRETNLAARYGGGRHVLDLIRESAARVDSPLARCYLDHAAALVSADAGALDEVSRRFEARRGLAVGARLRIGPPFGVLTYDLTSGRDVLLVAGSTGLAPLKAITEQIAALADPPQVHLFFGARTADGLYDIADLEKMAAGYPWLTVIPAASNDSRFGGEHGRLPDVVARSGNWLEHDAYVCGPTPMLEATVTQLTALGVPPSQIHVEDFGWSEQ